MRVLCINDSWNTGNSKEAPLPQFMKEYTVLYFEDIYKYKDDHGDQLKNGRYYTLAGIDDRYSYHASNFAILPDTTADEMADQENEAIANLEHQKV